MSFEELTAGNQAHTRRLVEGALFVPAWCLAVTSAIFSSSKSARCMPVRDNQQYLN